MVSAFYHSWHSGTKFDLVHPRYAFSRYLDGLLNAGDLTSPVMMRRYMQSSDVSLDRAWYIDRP
jgi:hypothetical protein